MTDEEKTHRLYLLLGEQVALGRCGAQPLTREASVEVITAQHNEIQRLKCSASERDAQDVSRDSK